MAVAAINAYEFPQVDLVSMFPAPLLNIGWDRHLMFCSPFCVPLPPTMVFGDMLKGPIAGMYGYHPDFAQIDWSKTEWLKSSKPWQPDYNKSLADNGLKHKDIIRFRTPGLNGIKGSCS